MPSPGDPQSLNRYSYVLNNPVKYTDPSGHWYGPDQYDPAGIEFFAEAYAYAKMSGEIGVLLDYCVQNYPTEEDRAERVYFQKGIPEQRDTIFRNDQQAQMANVFEYVADMLSAGLSFMGALTEIAGFGAAVIPGGQPVAVSALLADAGFQKAGDVLGFAGAGSDAFADLVAGYTYIDFGKTESGFPELVFGQDTLFGSATSALGQVSPLSLTDLVLDVGSVAYDLRGLAGATPSIEGRMTTSGIKLVIYNGK